jgi:NTE family protein
VASNYSLAREEVIAHGPLRQALLASTAIPGALPPVLRDGALLCDGGTFNNFPTDVMRARRGIGRVIGADPQANPPRRFAHDEVPGTWALLRDRLRRRRRYRLPTLLTYLLNVSILYSSSRRSQARAQADLCFSPPLHRVGMLQWDRFDSAVEQGHRHASEVLGRLDADTLQALRPHPG